jgi:hypothetical protein
VHTRSPCTVLSNMATVCGSTVASAACAAARRSWPRRFSSTTLTNAIKLGLPPRSTVRSTGLARGLAGRPLPLEPNRKFLRKGECHTELRVTTHQVDKVLNCVIHLLIFAYGL